MKWIVDFEEGKQRHFLRLDELEVKELIKILKDPYKKALKKLGKYQDIHESGEATERQENILIETEETVRLMDQIINS